MYFNFDLQPLEKLSDDNTKKLPLLIESVKKLEVFLNEQIIELENEQALMYHSFDQGKIVGLTDAKDCVTALINLYQNSKV